MGMRMLNFACIVVILFWYHFRCGYAYAIFRMHSLLFVCGYDRVTYLEFMHGLPRFAAEGFRCRSQSRVPARRDWSWRVSFFSCPFVGYGAASRA